MVTAKKKKTVGKNKLVKRAEALLAIGQGKVEEAIFDYLKKNKYAKLQTGIGYFDLLEKKTTKKTDFGSETKTEKVCILCAIGAMACALLGEKKVLEIAKMRADNNHEDLVEALEEHGYLEEFLTILENTFEGDRGVRPSDDCGDDFNDDELADAAFDLGYKLRDQALRIHLPSLYGFKSKVTGEDAEFNY